MQPPSRKRDILSRSGIQIYHNPGEKTLASASDGMNRPRPYCKAESLLLSQTGKKKPSPKYDYRLAKSSTK